jgi:hypothetical protein
MDECVCLLCRGLRLRVRWLFSSLLLIETALAEGEERKGTQKKIKFYEKKKIKFTLAEGMEEGAS